MPSIVKRKTSGVESSAFNIYTGDEPKAGGYRAVIKVVNMVKSKGDNLMFNVVVELRAKEGSAKSEYDGYAAFPQFVLTDNESNMQREQAFYRAIGASDDADTKTAGDASKFKPGDGQKTPVVTIGGIKPVGKIVNVRLRWEPANGEYPAALKPDMIFKVRDEDAADDDVVDDDDEGEETEEDGLPLYEEDDLNGKNLIALRKILAEEFDQDAAELKTIKSKKALVDLILELQEEVEDEDDDDADEEEEDDEDEEDSEEEEEEDLESSIREELAGMTRAELKASLTKREVAFRVLKSTTDDELREALVPSMLEDPPF